MYCSSCGHKVTDSASFCSSCGVEIKKTESPLAQQANKETQGSVTSDRTGFYRAAVGAKNVEYYLSRFARFDSNGASATWNWPAFFLSFFWLLHRKMYMWAAAYFLAPMPLAFIVGMTGNENVAMAAYIAYLVGIWVIFPMYANALYYRHVRARIDDAARTLGDEAQQLQFVAAKGGVGSVVLIVVLLSVPGVGVLAAIALPAYQDYTIRAQVSQAIVSGSEVKAAVTDYLISTNYESCPSSLSEIGISESGLGAGIATVAIADRCVIELTMGGSGPTRGMTVKFIPELTETDELVWTCESEIQNKYLPAACRT